SRSAPSRVRRSGTLSSSDAQTYRPLRQSHRPSLFAESLPFASMTPRWDQSSSPMRELSGSATLTCSRFAPEAHICGSRPIRSVLDYMPFHPSEAVAMALFGAHTSIAGGLHNALLDAHAHGMESVQLFTANPNRWAVTPPHPEEQTAFQSEQL